MGQDVPKGRDRWVVYEVVLSFCHFPRSSERSRYLNTMCSKPSEMFLLHFEHSSCISFFKLLNQLFRFGTRTHSLCLSTLFRESKSKDYELQITDLSMPTININLAHIPDYLFLSMYLWKYLLNIRIVPASNTTSGRAFLILYPPACVSNQPLRSSLIIFPPTLNQGSFRLLYLTVRL